jgi:uncharacterized protein
MPSSRILSILFFLLVVCSFAGGLIMIALQTTLGLGSDWQQTINENATQWQRDTARLMALINTLTTFLLPSLICAFIIARKKWYKLLGFNGISSYSNTFYSITIMLVSIPLIQYTYHLNQQLPLPTWMTDMEKASDILIKGILKTEYTYEVWLNMFLFAVIPALGEELFFRGIMQKQLKKMFSDPHLAIWTTAFIFSSIHFQFAGFIPRFLLGGVLGYVFYFTGSLWMPILGHFTNNALMVMLAHLNHTGQITMDIDKQDNFPWQAGILSLIFTLVILYILERNNETRLNEEEKALNNKEESY